MQAPSTEELYWLEMALTPGWSPRRLRRMTEGKESLTAALLQRLAASARTEKEKEEQAQLERILRQGPEKAEALWTACQKEKIGILTPASEAYPRLLRTLPDSPPALYYKGNPHILKNRCMAVVGSRRCTTYGAQAARVIAGVLSAAGITIVSGLARGIDRCGHEGALQNGGDTAAVLGCGIDICYPPEHRRLKEQILEQGLLLTEFPPGTAAKAAHFPMRNRIISGLCEGVIVVEAGERSGSLITADMALEQGRDVYCVPGSFFSPANRGGHKLLQQGAALLAGPEDLAVFGGGGPNEEKEEKEGHWLLQAVAEFGSTPEELCLATGRSPEEIQQAVTFLQIERKIRVGADQRIMKAQEL